MIIFSNFTLRLHSQAALLTNNINNVSYNNIKFILFCNNVLTLVKKALVF